MFLCSTKVEAYRNNRRVGKLDECKFVAHLSNQTETGPKLLIHSGFLFMKTSLDKDFFYVSFV